MNREAAALGVPVYSIFRGKTGAIDRQLQKEGRLVMIETAEEVQQVVEYYCLRWQIEVYFRTLKSGCRVEERQFETLSHIENSLAVYTIVAWRVMYLRCLGRACPDLSCAVALTPSEWK